MAENLLSSRWFGLVSLGLEFPGSDSWVGFEFQDSGFGLWISGMSAGFLGLDFCILNFAIWGIWLDGGLGKPLGHSRGTWAAAFTCRGTSVNWEVRSVLPLYRRFPCIFIHILMFVLVHAFSLSHTISRVRNSDGWRMFYGWGALRQACRQSRQPYFVVDRAFGQMVDGAMFNFKFSGNQFGIILKSFALTFQSASI